MSLRTARRTSSSAIRRSSLPIWGVAMSLLSVRNVGVTYGKVVALEGVSLTVESGELVTLVGANGAGKSTLMKAITGLVRPSAGEIELEGRSLIGQETYDIARLGIAYVPEGRGNLRELSVRENLRLGAFALRGNADVR